MEAERLEKEKNVSETLEKQNLEISMHQMSTKASMDKV